MNSINPTRSQTRIYCPSRRQSYVMLFKLIKINLIINLTNKYIYHGRFVTEMCLNCIPFPNESINISKFIAGNCRENH